MERFKTMLAQMMTEAQGRNMFTGTEFHDMLLDLWLALDADAADIPDSVPELESV